MRTSNELKRSVTRDVIERYPKADGLRSFDAIIGLVLVPWRCNIGLHFFDQDVLVEQANGLTLHQFGCNLPNGGVKNEILVLGYPLPIAVITVKLTVTAVALITAATWSGMRQFQAIPTRNVSTQSPLIP